MVLDFEFLCYCGPRCGFVEVDVKEVGAFSWIEFHAGFNCIVGDDFEGVFERE